MKHAIPVRTFADWDDAKPGFTEVDLVAHCGDTTRGEYLHSLNMVDVKTRWTEFVPLLNKSQATVTAGIDQCRQRLPYALLGWDSDNGSEFINNDLKRSCEQRKITLTRCRPYKRNDQADVEQKNWTAIRQTVGYERYEGQAPCDRLMALLSTTAAVYQLLPARQGARQQRAQRCPSQAQIRSGPNTLPAHPGGSRSG